MKLKLSSDRKVTTKARITPSGRTPLIKNAFGLPAHVSCPGATDVCRDTCYAFKLEKAYTGVRGVLQHNWDALQELGDDWVEMGKLLHQMVCEYDVQHEKVQAKYDEPIPKSFRIHWDGDFYSEPYARAWAAVVKLHSDTQFWVYTRSFTPDCNVVPWLTGIKNLSLYLSVDEDNKTWAKQIIKSHPSVMVAVLDNTFDEAKATSIELIGKKAPKCPEQTGRYPLVTDNEQGACIECNMCVNGVNNVLFSKTKR